MVYSQEQKKKLRKNLKEALQHSRPLIHKAVRYSLKMNYHNYQHAIKDVFAGRTQMIIDKIEELNKVSAEEYLQLIQKAEVWDKKK